MKKYLMAAVLAGLFASTGFAVDSRNTMYQMTRLGVDIQYTRVEMAQVNKQLNNGTSVRMLSDGIAAMGYFEIVLTPFLLLGVRSGYIYCLPGVAAYNYILFNQTTTINASLIPIEAGVSVNIDLPEAPISLKVGVFAGYGLAFGSIKNDISALGQTATFTQPYNGGSYIGEATASVSYNFSPVLALSINGGYRLANIPQMLQSEDVSYNGIPGITVPIGAKGDVLKDSDNKDMAFNFSGFNIGLGLNFGF